MNEMLEELPPKLPQDSSDRILNIHVKFPLKNIQNMHLKLHPDTPISVLRTKIELEHSAEPIVKTIICYGKRCDISKPISHYVNDKNSDNLVFIMQVEKCKENLDPVGSSNASEREEEKDASENNMDIGARNNQRLINNEYVEEELKRKIFDSRKFRNYEEKKYYNYKRCCNDMLKNAYGCDWNVQMNCQDTQHSEHNIRNKIVLKHLPLMNPNFQGRIKHHCNQKKLLPENQSKLPKIRFLGYSALFQFGLLAQMLFLFIFISFATSVLATCLMGIGMLLYYCYRVRLTYRTEYNRLLRRYGLEEREAEGGRGPVGGRRAGNRGNRGNRDRENNIHGLNVEENREGDRLHGEENIDNRNIENNIQMRRIWIWEFCYTLVMSLNPDWTDRYLRAHPLPPLPAHNQHIREPPNDLHRTDENPRVQRAPDDQTDQILID